MKSLTLFGHFWRHQLRTTINYRLSPPSPTRLFPRSCLTVIFFLCSSTSWIDSIEALCPSRCRCDDSSLSADCTQSGLDVLPITLNPQLARLQLAGNHIRSIQQTLSFYNGLQLLDLSANHLQTLGQNNLAQLNRLQQLLLDRNRLHRIESNSLAGLQRLRQLSLSGNQLGELPGRAFSDLGQLQRLSLAQNHLAQLHPEWSVGLRSLLHLNLSSNQLPSGAQLAVGWAHLPALVELDLNHNPLHFLTPDTFASLHQLRTLHLQNCLLQNIHENAFRPLRSLLHLVISQNPLTRIPSDALQPLTQLRSLRANSLKLVSFERNDFVSLKSLTFLELGQEQLLERLDDRLFQTNHELRTLIIEDCPLLSRLPVDFLFNNSQLHELRLRNNAIRHLPQPQLSTNFPGRLRMVLLSGNPLHCDCNLWWVVQHNLEPPLPQLIQQTQSPASLPFFTLNLMQADSTDQLSNRLLPVDDFASRSRNQMTDDDEWANHISSIPNPSLLSTKWNTHSRLPTLSADPFVRLDLNNRVDHSTYRHSSHSGRNLWSQLLSTTTTTSTTTHIPSIFTQPMAALQAECASPPALKGRLVRSIPADLLRCSTHTQSSQTDVPAMSGSSKQPVPNDTRLVDSVRKLLPSIGNFFLLLSILLLFTVAFLFCARFNRHFHLSACCCKGWRLWWSSCSSAKRRQADRLPTPSHLSQAAGQRHSIASSGGGSMKPLCGSNTLMNESKCLFAPGSFDSAPPRYSKLRLLPLSSEQPPSYTTVSQQFSPDNHDYEQVRYYDAIGPGRTLLPPPLLPTSGHAHHANHRLYENPIHSFETLRKASAQRQTAHHHSLPAMPAPSLQSFGGGHLV